LGIEEKFFVAFQRGIRTRDAGIAGVEEEIEGIRLATEHEIGALVVFSSSSPISLLMGASSSNSASKGHGFGSLLFCQWDSGGFSASIRLQNPWFM